LVILREMRSELLIVTRDRDFHARALRLALAARGLRTQIIVVDRLHRSSAISWALDGTFPLGLRDWQDEPVDLAAMRALWLRRLRGDPEFPPELGPPEQEFVVNECRGALEGILRTEFHGRWIDGIEATRGGENKLAQLRAARAAGLRVPDTLVSQDPVAVRTFCEAQGMRVVAKALVGAPRVFTLTGKLTTEMLADDDAIRWAPAIYQRCVEGERHLRVCVFGERIVAVALRSDRLDWRHPLDADMAPAELDSATAAGLRCVLASLGLSMGIFDLKLDENGPPWFLEVNPQGQFLFMEQRAGVPLLECLADFMEEAVRCGLST
jgi:hypothetical protein